LLDENFRSLVGTSSLNLAGLAVSWHWGLGLVVTVDLFSLLLLRDVFFPADPQRKSTKKRLRDRKF
jgi:hypothetical protein